MMKTLGAYAHNLDDFGGKTLVMDPVYSEMVLLKLLSGTKHSLMVPFDL